MLSLVSLEIKPTESMYFDVDLGCLSSSYDCFRNTQCYKLYRYCVNGHEYELRLPVCDGTVLWPADKLPRRKYPAFVYLYSVALYLSTNMSQQKVAQKVKKLFGLPSFSHSTISRTLKRLKQLDKNMLEHLNSTNSLNSSQSLVIRKHWSEAEVSGVSQLLSVLAPILTDITFSRYLVKTYWDITGGQFII
jgi:hypothetical protein